MATLGHLLDGNTLALWRLDEASGSSNAADATGTYTAPAVSNGGFPSVVSGLIADGGRAKRFNGGYYNPTGDAAMATALLGEWTIEAWINLDSIPSGIDARIVDIQDVTKRFVWFSVTQNGNLEVFWQGASNQLFDGAPGSISAGTRYHVGARKTSVGGGNYRADLFINGVKVSSSGSLANSTAVSVSSADVGTGVGGAPFTGIIDDVRISKVARTDAEIADSFWRGLIDRQSPQFAVPALQVTSNQDFQNYQKALSPTALTDPPGTLFESSFGSMKDLFADRVRASIKSRLPQNAPPDALTQIGTERGMPQGQSELGSAYAARLQDAWNAWPWAGTAFGLLRAFYATGYTNVVLAQVRGGKQFTLDNGGTNLLQWSNDLANGVWNDGPGGLTLTRNATTAPDGTTTAMKLAESTTSNVEHYVGQSIAIAASQSGTFVIVAKAAERTWLHLAEVLRDATNVPGAYYDLTNGVLGSIVSSGGVTPTAKITSIGNGWYRCELTASVGAGGTNPRIRIQLASANGTKIYAGTIGSGLYVAYAGVEQSAGPAGPYVQTYSANAPSTLGAGVLLTSTMGSGIWETDPLSSYSPANQSFWSKFDVVFPLPLMPPSWGWAGGIPSSSSAESNFIRALIQAWKPAHATVNRIVIVQQGNVWGYPAAQLWGASPGLWGGSANTVWVP